MSSSSEQLDDRANTSFVDYVDSLRIPYEDIELATNNFSDANLLPIQSPSSSSFQKLIYKGQLKQSRGQLIDVVARRIMEAQDNIVFNELLTSYLLTHKHILRVFKISGTDDPIIINKYEANESLDKHLSDSTLTWMQRLHICVGVAHALSYIHDFDAEGDFSVIHGNIKSSKILLDKFWEPMLNCFGFSMFVKKHQPHLTSKYNGAVQYVDPEYEITEGLTHKSDVFSFGVVLFEVLFGEIASVKDEDNWYFAKLARSTYENERLGDKINVDLHKQMDLKSLDIFSETAYCCLKEVSSERLNMVQIAKNLEASLELQRNHESLMNFEGNTDDAPMKVSIIVDHAPTAPETEIMSSPNDFAHLKIPLEDILSATNNFAETNVIETADFGNIYKGQLLQSGELININAQRIKKERKQAEHEFWMEISMLASLKHKNLVSIVGFCDEKDEKVIIIMNEARGCLNEYLYKPMSLTWLRRLKICVGLAHALSYIHYDEQHDFSVIHRDIRSFTVQLNDDWEPKLSNFKFSMKIEASQRHHSFHTDTLEYTNGYGDPMYLETKSVNHKSDIYSFGIVMFELLCGRDSIIDDDYNKYLAPVAVTHYREKKLYEIIDWDLWKQMDSQSFNIFTEIAYECLNEERSQRPNIDEIVPRLQKALELARENSPILSLPSNEFAHLKTPLEYIMSATNNFSEKNCIGTSGFAMEYKGQLLWSGKLIDITAQRLNKERYDEDEHQFWIEISLLSTLKHKNLVSLVGFCDENGEKIIITRHNTRGSLDNYLSDPMLLTWVRRLKICVGLAHALSYIHYDEPRDFSVIHRKINSGAVLLNADWEPKLSDIECSMKVEVSQRYHSFHNETLQYTNGYVDPTYLDTGSVNHKSDIYSFGIVMLELLCGRDSIIDDDYSKYLAPVAITHYREKKLNEIIDWDLWKQMDLQSCEIFAEIAYDCLNEERSQRPNIDEIVPRLEKALELQLCQNANYGAADSTTTIRRHQFQTLEDIAIPLKDIISATSDFSQSSQIGDGGFGVVYKGRLSEHWQNHEVVIKRLNKTGHEGKEFLNEVTLISRFHHQNIISFIGYCDEGDEMILVYEYANNGSLDNHLENTTRRRDLTWVKRLQICLGAAKGLNYLHSGLGEENKVIHGDVKSGKILLDENMEAKICDFGLSKLESTKNYMIDTNVAGTNYYMDPIYHENGILRTESDVYSFGVVMFEMLCGMPAYHRRKIGDGKLQPMIKLVRRYYNYGKELLIDPYIKDQIDNSSLQTFIETAYLCISFNSKDRPSMKTVADKIKEALDLQETAIFWSTIRSRRLSSKPTEKGK